MEREKASLNEIYSVLVEYDILSLVFLPLYDLSLSLPPFNCSPPSFSEPFHPYHFDVLLYSYSPVDFYIFAFNITMARAKTSTKIFWLKVVRTFKLNWIIAEVPKHFPSASQKKTFAIQISIKILRVGFFLGLQPLYQRNNSNDNSSFFTQSAKSIRTRGKSLERREKSSFYSIEFFSFFNKPTSRGAELAGAVIFFLHFFSTSMK